MANATMGSGPKRKTMQMGTARPMGIGPVPRPKQTPAPSAKIAPPSVVGPAKKKPMRPPIAKKMPGISPNRNKVGTVATNATSTTAIRRPRT